MGEPLYFPPHSPVIDWESLYPKPYASFQFDSAHGGAPKLIRYPPGHPARTRYQALKIFQSSKGFDFDRYLRYGTPEVFNASMVMTNNGISMEMSQVKSLDEIIAEQKEKLKVEHNGVWPLPPNPTEVPRPAFLGMFQFYGPKHSQCVCMYGTTTNWDLVHLSWAWRPNQVHNTVLVLNPWQSPFW